MAARAGRDRVFARALFISALLHLSAITIFRIVIYFPREDVHYFDVSIVETAPNRRLTVPEPAIDAPANAPSGGEIPLGQTLALNNPLEPQLPDIELPTLRFDELSLLRLKQEALEVRTRYDELFGSRTNSAYSRMSSGFDTMTDTLKGLTFGGDSGSDLNRPRPVSRPAPGFEAYVEWFGEPKDRQVFEVKPLPELRGLPPDAVPEPITLAFRVDRSGAVTRVINPVNDAQGIAVAAADALRGYRFEPLLGDGPEEQSGTFVLRAGGGGS